MNSPGDTISLPGRFQRSNPKLDRAAQVEERLVVQLELAPVDRAPQSVFEREAPLRDTFMCCVKYW